MDLGQWIIIVLSGFLGVWYIFAGSYNRRRGLDMYEWLREGLESVGKVTEASWIGSSGSGARLVVGQPGHPFRRIEVVFLLESREILPLWVVNRLRGKKDELILKANLRRVPAQEIEVARATDRGFQAALERESGPALRMMPAPAGFQAAGRQFSSENPSSGLTSFLADYPDSVFRMSLRRSQPHLILRAYLPGLQAGGSADRFIKGLQEWLTAGGAGQETD